MINIQQFIDQATIRVNNPIVNSKGEVVCDSWETGVSMSKLVELVVNECAGIAKQFHKNNKDYDASLAIKQHFGVEE